MPGAEERRSIRRTTVAPGMLSAFVVLRAPISRILSGCGFGFGLKAEFDFDFRKDSSGPSHLTRTRLESPPRSALWPIVLASWYVARPPNAESWDSRSLMSWVSCSARARASRFCRVWWLRIRVRVCLDDRDEEALEEAGAAALVDREDRSGGRPDLRDFGLDFEDRPFLDKGGRWCEGAMLQALAPDIVERSYEVFEKQKCCCHCLCKCFDANIRSTSQGNLMMLFHVARKAMELWALTSQIFRSCNCDHRRI